MPRDLRQGDKGDDVSELQSLLNRVGGLLPEDNAFGPQTDDAVRDAQAMAGQPVSGIADAALIGWLKARPEPSAVVPTVAIAYIAREEVSGRIVYKAKYQRPIWPGGESGVTIGIGYDLRMQTATFEADWQGLLTAADLAVLRPTLGRQGTTAMAQSAAACAVPLSAAWPNFAERVLPRYADQTRAAFGGTKFDALKPLCRGALVSLVYNRGAGMTDSSADDRRREMRAIRDHIQVGAVGRVADEFRAMKRLWPDAAGLRARRDREADMWERGLGGVA